MLRIKYYNRGETEPQFLDINNDVCGVLIEAQEGVPALEVTVNTDAVRIDTQSGSLLFMQDFGDIAASVEAETVIEGVENNLKLGHHEIHIDYGVDGEGDQLGFSGGQMTQSIGALIGTILCKSQDPDIGWKIQTMTAKEIFELWRESRDDLIIKHAYIRFGGNRPHEILV